MSSAAGGSIEKWTPEATGWDYKPSGDGHSSYATYPSGMDYLTERFGTPAPRITGKPYRMGYIYGYWDDGTYRRRAVPSLPVIQELTVLAEAMWRGPYTGMSKSKAADAVFALIMNVRHATERFPVRENYACITPAKLDAVRTLLARLKKVPDGLLADLARLEALGPQIVYVPCVSSENK